MEIDATETQLKLLLYMEITFRSIIFFIGVPGNILIMYYFFNKYQNELHVSSLVTTLLALTDFITCLIRAVNILLTAFDAALGHGYVACEYMYFMPIILTDVSLLTLLMFSYHRYRLITKPFAKCFSETVVILLYLMCYPLAAVSYIPYFDSHVVGANIKICRAYRHPKSIMVLMVTNFFYGFVNVIIPVASIVVFYRRVRSTLKKQAAFVRQSSQLKDEFNHNMVAAKTLKTLTVLMLATIAFPRCLLIVQYGLTLHVENFSSSYTYYIIRCVVYNILVTNNAINVFVYFHHIKEFRRFVFNKINRVAMTTQATIVVPQPVDVNGQI